MPRDVLSGLVLKMGRVKKRRDVAPEFRYCWYLVPLAQISA